MKINKKPDSNKPASTLLSDLALSGICGNILIDNIILKKNIKYPETQTRKVSRGNAVRIKSNPIESNKTELIFKYTIKTQMEEFDLVVKQNKLEYLHKITDLLNQHYMTDPELKAKVKERIESFFKHYYP